MEVVLQAKDANEWSYKGEGAFNLIVSYIGTSSHFIGKILRIPKVSRNGSDYQNGQSALTKHECLVWKEHEDIVSAPTKEIAEQLYVKHVMVPLLGTEHVDAGIRVAVSREFLEAVENNSLCQRPSWRVEAAKVNILCNTVLLMSDHSVFPRGSISEERCLTVEIKAKCGFLPCSEFIAEKNAVKSSVTRFQMHQALKLCEGKISEISEYDPADLFSGSKERVHKAITGLFNIPQNNFRVFLNGALILGGLGGGAESTDRVIGEAFEDALKRVILAEDGMRTKYFIELVAEAVSTAGLLDRLLEAQKLDNIDIEGAIHAYYDIISQPCVVCRDIGESKLSKRYGSLHSIPKAESLKIVKNYLISATAKDLSMMLTFRPREDGDPKSTYHDVFLKSTNQSFDYKASFIDLDMKPLKKMEYYYKLDQQIVSCYIKTVKGENQLENAANVKDISPSDEYTSSTLDHAHSEDASGNQ